MCEVSHTLSIIQFCRLDLSGEAKQAAKVPHNAAPLCFDFSPVSELLFELLYCKRTEMLYELYWKPPGVRTWAPGLRFGHQTLRKQRSIMEQWVVIPGGALGSPGLLLGFLGLSGALWQLSGCSWLLLDRSWGQFAGTKEKQENDVNLTNLAGQI